MKNNKIKECYNCDEKINIDTEFFFLKNQGCFLCKDCMKISCYKCKEIKHLCFKCKIMHCTNCDDGCYYSNSWNDIDINYCNKCRHITVDELYNYFKNKYNETLTLEQIKKLILE